MNAIVINKFGEAAEVFENENRLVPAPNGEEVLVKVIATAVNPIDLYVRKGYVPDLVPSFPAVIHGEAAAIPLVGLTAYESIFLRAKVQPGQTVLVYGGIGGVGQMGIQFAKIAGAVVYATVSNDEQAALVKSLGADHVINYKNESVEDFCTKIYRRYWF